MKVEPFDGETEVLSRLVSKWPFKPYRWADVSADALHALSVARLRELLEREGVRSWIAAGPDPGASGIAMLDPLPWDSRMLRRCAARAEFIVAGEYEARRKTFDALLETSLHEARRAGVEHLSVRVSATDAAAIHALESAGFLSVDALLTFERPVARGPEEDEQDPPPDLVLREARVDDGAAIEALAASAFVDGRFHADPSIDASTATGVYREWAASCCRGSAADGVVVAATGTGEIVGFVACRVHPDTGLLLARLTASIVLIATAATARRRGVGKAIVQAALEWAGTRSVVALQVGTQIGNTSAARLYERCGFRLAAASQSFSAVISR